MTTRVIKQEAELRNIADAISETIYYRIYENGCSDDLRMVSTDKEKSIIFNLAYGALLGMNWNRADDSTAQAIINATEFQLDLMIRSLNEQECNGYMTIYIPLQKALQEWERKEVI